MAITDNVFSAEEFKAAMTANADLLPIIKGTLAESKYVVQDETEHTNFLKTHESEVSGRITKDHADKLEADVLALTGIPKKDANEKYYDYFKRATGEKLSTVSALQVELDALKAGHKPSEVDKARIAELEKALGDKTTEFTEKLTAKEKEVLDIKKGGIVSGEVAKIRGKYKAGLPESMVKIAEGQIVQKVTDSIVIQSDGAVTIVDKDGNIKMNKSTYKPVTVEEELVAELSDLIDPGKKVTGTGTDPNADQKKDQKGTVEWTGLPAEIDTKMKLSSYMLKLGYVQGTPEFDKIFNENEKDLKLR